MSIEKGNKEKKMKRKTNGLGADVDSADDTELFPVIEADEGRAADTKSETSKDALGVVGGTEGLVLLEVLVGLDLAVGLTDSVLSSVDSPHELDTSAKGLVTPGE